MPHMHHKAVSRGGVFLSSRLPSHEMHALHLHARTCTCTHAPAPARMLRWHGATAGKFPCMMLRVAGAFCGGRSHVLLFGSSSCPHATAAAVVLACALTMRTARTGYAWRAAWRMGRRIGISMERKACVRTTSGLHVYIQKQTDLQALPVHGDEAYAEREIHTTAKLSSMSDPGGNRPQAQDRIRRRQSQWGTFTIGRHPAHPEQSRQRIMQEGVLLVGLQALLRQQKAAY